MDPATIVATISARLNLVDKFRTVTLDFLKRENKPVSVEAKQAGDTLQIKRGGHVAEEISGDHLHMNEWDAPRYQALEKRVKSNWRQYNGLYGELPIVSVDERIVSKNAWSQCALLYAKTSTK